MSRDIAIDVCKRLNAASHQAWLVGGCVRDSVMGRAISDWDIATDASPVQILQCFDAASLIGGHTGTVAVDVQSERFEITPFRAEGSYSDGRHPDNVCFVSTIEEDLSRRDFTMNAIAHDPLRDVWADPFSGRADISRQIIRAVGDESARFREDALRLMRAARFASTLGFDLAASTEQAVLDNHERLRVIAPERVHDELHKCMTAVSPSRTFELMARTLLIDEVLPELRPLIGCQQNRYHSFDVWGHTMRVLDAVAPQDVVLRFAGLLHDVAKPQTRGTHPVTGDVTFYNHEEVGACVADDILHRLKFSNDERSRIVHHVRHHLIPYESDWSSAAVRRWVRRVGRDNAQSLCQLGRADIAGKGVTSERAALIDELETRVNNMSTVIVTHTNELAVSGADVMSILHIGPGPQVGQVLRNLIELVTEHPELNSREELIKRLQKF